MYKYQKLDIPSNMPFYHGTHAFFERFEDHCRGSNSGWDNTVHGFFFADKKENALLFGDTIITAHLDIQKTLDLRMLSIFNEESQASLIWDILSGEKLDNRTALQTIYDEISLGELSEMWDALNSDYGHEKMVAAGYDSIVSNLGDGQFEYVVFNASQIDILSIDRKQYNRYSR